MPKKIHDDFDILQQKQGRSEDKYVLPGFFSIAPVLLYDLHLPPQ
jgi:hypothetical protein